MTIHGRATALSSIVARNSDGTGNNIANPTWGTAGGTYVRITDTTYGTPDGLSWDTPKSNGGVLPSPVVVADNTVSAHDNVDIPNSFGVNETFQFFGQFLAHDISQARPGARGENSEPLLDGGTFPATRDASIIDDEGIRQTVTNTTSYLDLSMVYGKSDTVQSLLRQPDTGRLIMSDDDLLPTIASVAQIHGRDSMELLPLFLLVPTSDQLAATGDERAFQSPQLLSYHTMFARNHNYHADRLEDLYPDWSADEIFEAARALNEAEFQSIVYDEFVAKLYGSGAVSEYAGYDQSVDASIINEWTTVANRYGHDQATDSLTGLDEAGNETFTFTLSETISKGATALQTEEDLNVWVRGQMAQQSQEIDGKFAHSVGILPLVPGVNLDLRALDIARGRDHGVNDYNNLRAGIGLSVYEDFDAFGAANGIDAVTIETLKTVYDNDISKLDALVGGLLEKDALGSQLGETFTAIGIQQYENLRNGDRFYYEERFKDHPELIAEIKATSFADIIARTTGVEHVYRDAFLAHERIGGDDGHDFLMGTNDADLIIGFGGSDVLIGRKGNDDLYGGAGHDKLYGGSDDDHLYGGDGRDYLHGGRGEDTLIGGAGNDTLSGSYGDDFMAGGEGRDKIFGGSGTDMLIGDAGHDRLYGGSGDDFLAGGEGRDWLYGGHHDDKMMGGAGNDTYVGGQGDDVYIFGDNSGHDRVYGFRSGEDKLDLSAYGFESVNEVKQATSSSFWGFRSQIELDDENSVTFYGFNAKWLDDGDLIL